MASQALGCRLGDDSVVVEEDFAISFRRTIRVPDNNQMSFLPPDLGSFPLMTVSDHLDKIPASMASKGGLFFPMHQSEAMWINFNCRRSSKSYSIKIYVGGVNAISGEPAEETAATKLRRQTKLSNVTAKRQVGLDHPSLQDYIVVPGQRWLDGIAESNGTVRQFVAMPLQSGHSIEYQVAGQDVTGGLQFEVTPSKPIPLEPSGTQPISFNKNGTQTVIVRTPIGENIVLKVDSENESVLQLKSRLFHKEGLPLDGQRLMFKGRQMEDKYNLRYYDVQEGSKIYLIPRLRGGGDPGRVYHGQEMSIAAGGQIKQVIYKDDNTADWLPERTTVFNVQVLNSVNYREVTGGDPPPTPIDAETYKMHGLPFFDLYAEPTGIVGDFSNVKSVAEIDEANENEVYPPVLPIGHHVPPIGLLNPNGPLRPFRTVKDLEVEYSRYHVARF
ncbi:integral membrane protein [Amniculicola lignicola CBS 123094]|uniref:Integral membrane protein n=1 Tax=Amniculicola lignicola CBS 123094 TaxID=1392246 RepID=A0A6A5WWS5_9PLEO|nr:integral membrane protein [Amniculicola lignicola CBS 123094]